MWCKFIRGIKAKWPKTGVKQGVMYLHAPFKLTVAVVTLVFSDKSRYFSHALCMRETRTVFRISVRKPGRIEYLT